MDEIQKIKNDNLEKKEISLWKLFTTFFKINAITFGGGYTIVPIIKDKFVRDYGLMSEDEMLDIMALAQSGPGAKKTFW